MTDRTGPGDHWTQFHETLRTPDCTRGHHQDCPHMWGLGGGGINPRRLRPEFGADLCRCSCHSSCPVTITTRRMTVPLKAWYESCSCPGADQARRSQDDAGINPDFRAQWEEAQDRSRVRKEAFAATKARAAGLNREQVRQAYLEELHARNLKIPPDPVLKVAVDSIMGNPLPAARLLGQHFTAMGKEIHNLIKLFTQDR
jgi:hypothetical protein